MLLSTSKFISTIFKQQLTNISTVLNNTGNTTQLLTSFNALDVAQRKVLLSSKLLTEEQKAQCVTMTALSSANVKYTAEQLAKTTGVSAETLANWGLIKSTDTLTISELAEKAASDAQAKSVLEKIIAQNAQAVANGEVTASNVALATSEKNATLATGTLTTAIKANTVAMLEWLFTNPVGWCILVAGAVYGLSKAYNYLSESEKRMADAHKESVEKVKQSISEYEELEQELETIQQTYDDNEQKLKDLYKLRESQTITQAEQDYLEELEGQNEKLRQQIEYKQTLADINAQEVEDEAVKELNNKTNNDLFNGHSNNGGYTFEYDKITDAEKIKQNSASINALTADLVAYEKVIQGIPLSQEEIDKYTQLLVSYQEQINNIKGESFEDEGKKQGFQSEIDKINKLLNGTLTYEEYEKAVSEVTSSVQSLVTENDTLLQRVEPLNDAIKSTTGENYELKKANDEIIANAKDAAIGFNEYTDSLNGTADALNNVQGSTLDDEITVSFSDVFDSSDFSDTKQSLLELAKAGELTSYTLSSTKEYNSLLEQTGLTAEQVYEKIMKIAHQDMTDADWQTTLTNARSQIAKIDELLYELNTNGQTNSFVDDIISDYPQLLKYLGNEKELREQLKILQEEQEDTARKAYTQLVADSEEYYETFKTQETERLNLLNNTINATISNNKHLIDVLGKNYKIDLNNYKSITDAKAKLEMELIKNSASAWSKFYKVQVDATTGYASVISTHNMAPADYLGSDGNYGTAVSKFVEEQQKQKQAAQDVADTYNSIIAALESIADTTNISTAPVSSSSSSSSKEAEKTVETFDWIEKLIERIQSRIAKLEKTASSTYKSWAERNKALLKQLSEVNTEINAQQKAYDTYMAKANSVGLSEHYKQLVQNGGYSIEDITDDTLKNKISEYEEWYNKAMDCSDAIDDLKNNILELTTTQFENVFNEYEDSLSGYRHQIEMLETYIDQTEAKGYVVSGNYYKQLIATEKLNIKMLQDEYAKLKDSLQLSVDTGKIVAYSDAWYDMVDNIRNVQKSIEDANTSLIDYQTTLRELEWESFDRFMDKISSIKDESDFLIELMSDKDMFNEDGITDEGQATLGLHAINYNVYLSKAEEYAKELKDINEEIANDPNNQTLLERRQELLELQQESILASKDEQQAMKDLVSEGYDVFLESLQKIIDKQKELLNSQKD